MMKILLLSHDLDAATEWVLQQDLENPFILDEREIALSNPTLFGKGFYDTNYSPAMVEKMRIMQMTFKSSRPLFMLMDMRHQTAVQTVAHDVSVLYYDNSLTRRLAYNPTYKADHIVGDSGSVLLQELLQKSV